MWILIFIKITLLTWNLENKINISIINSFAETKFEKEPKDYFSESIFLKKGLNIIYAGNLGRFQGLGSVIKSFSLIKKYSDIRLILLGEGEEKEKFIKGAEIAYETIITAFAKGDKKSLKGLLTPRMATNFNQAISDREDKGIKSELTFIGMKESNLEKFEKVQDNIFATVKFVSDIISVKKDKSNNVLEGNPDRIKTVTDHWKFSKKETSNSPNWYLAEILPKWKKKIFLHKKTKKIGKIL